MSKFFSVKKDGFTKIYSFLGLKIKRTDKYKKIKNQIDDVYINLLNSINELSENNKELNHRLEILNEKIQSVNEELASQSVAIKVQSLHRETFSPFRNKHKEQTVVLIASGPSVKKFQPVSNAVYVSVNDSCQYDKVKFDYLFLQELHYNSIKNKVVNEYNAEKCIKFYGIIPEKRLDVVYPYVKLIPKTDTYSDNIRRYYLDDKFCKKFTSELEMEALGDFGGTVFSAMQFILYTHPKRILLVGCDCSQGNIFNDTNYDCSPMIGRWQTMKRFIDDIYPDIEVVSVNPVGLKGLFRDFYTE